MDCIISNIKSNQIPVFQIVKSNNNETHKVIFEEKEELHNVYSISKNFIATAIGILIDEGKLCIDQSIYSIFRNKYTWIDTKWDNVKIKDVLTQTTGIENGFLDIDCDNVNDYPYDDYLIMVFQKELKFKPGTHFAYSDSNYYLLSRIIKEITAENSQNFIIEKILTPLKITEYSFVTDPQGNFMGGTGLNLNAEAIMKLGLLYLNDGIYDGVQILSNTFVKGALTPYAIVDKDTSYGYSFWFKNKYPNVIQGNGMFGQEMFINLKNKTVIAWTAFSVDSKTNQLVEQLLELSKN